MELQRALDLVDAYAADIYQFDILMALRSYRRILPGLFQNVVISCWMRTGI